MHRERKLSALRRALRDEGWVSRGDEVSFFCTRPKPRGCGGEHHKRKLSVNLNTDKFHCWVCGWGGPNLEPLLKSLGEQDRDYLDYVAERRPEGEQAPAKVYDRVKLPREFRPLCVPSSSLYHRQAMAYLAGRGITSDDVLTYKLGYCESGPLAERVVIPSFDEHGELNFVVGRGIWERVSPPYMTNGKYDKDIIFNDLLVDWSRPVTLVEGPFDALKAGTNAVPLQGKFVSKKLLDKIIAKRTPVLVALDQDALADSLKIAERLMAFGVQTGIVNWPKELKDPGDMTKEQFESYRSKTKPFQGAVDVVKFRVFHSSSLEGA